MHENRNKIKINVNRKKKVLKIAKLLNIQTQKNSTRHIIHRRRTGKIEYITEFLVKNTSIHSKHTAVISRFIGITEILFRHKT